MAKYHELKFTHYPNNDEFSHITLEVNDVEFDQLDGGLIEMRIGIKDDEKINDLRLTYPLDRNEAEQLIIYLKQQFKL